MKPSGLVFVATLACCTTAQGEATAPLDVTQRHEPFAPAASITPGKRNPATTRTLQNRTLEMPRTELARTPASAQQSPLAVAEQREKHVREFPAKRPSSMENARSALDRRPSSISTRDTKAKPPLVAKYQESLAAASASNMARFPATEAHTKGKLNRFVFRKNPPENEGPSPASAVLPAAGGSRSAK